MWFTSLAKSALLFFGIEPSIAFFEWIDRQFERQGLLPSSPSTQALGYARERRVGLEVFLEDPDVQMDTNHLERALRVTPRLWKQHFAADPLRSDLYTLMA